MDLSLKIFAHIAQIWTIGSLVYSGGNRNMAFAAGTALMFYGMNTSSPVAGLGYYSIYAGSTLYILRNYSTSASVPIRYLEASFIPAMITIASRCV